MIFCNRNGLDLPRSNLQHSRARHAVPVNVAADPNNRPTMLTEEQQIRYSRHIFLPEIDKAGQERLCSAKITIIGMGGLGSAVAYYLAASGIGTLFISDNEIIELSNLQRQILYSTADVGTLKIQAAKKNLLALNNQIEICPLPGLPNEAAVHTEKLSENWQQALQQSDVIIDCSDNFSTRYAVNALCVRYKKPFVSGSALAWRGQVSLFPLHIAGNACYNCLYPESPNHNEEQLNCSLQGVISPLVGIIGSMQALEVLKILLNLDKSNISKLWRFDALSGEWHFNELKRDLTCSICKIKE